ncbi:MAG: PEGA domain-containing protein [Polyangiaceae bacterium]
MRARVLRTAAFLLAVATSASVVACGPARSASTVSLRMSGTPATALVTIDDQVMGPLGFVGKRGVALPPGDHRVSVEAPGYFPVDRVVHADREPVRLEIALEPVPR